MAIKAAVFSPENWYETFVDGRIESKVVPLDNELRQVQGWESDQKDVFSLRYYTAISQTVGRRYTLSVQDTTTNIVPTKPYNQYLPWLGGLREGKMTRLEYRMPSPQEIIENYGEEFTIEKCYEIFSDIMLPFNEVPFTRKVIPYIDQYLDILNGFFISPDFNNFILGPSHSEINNRISELFLSNGLLDEDSLLKFLWMDSNGAFRRTQIMEGGGEEIFTTKAWLENIRQKIIEYQGTDRSLLKAQTIIEDRASRQDHAESLNLLEREKFTEEEANLGEAILEAIMEAFGHFTVRLTFGNMLDYYYTINGIGIKVMQRPALNTREYDRGSQADVLPSMLNHIGLILSTSRYDSNIIRIRDDLKVNHLFSFLFLDNKINLPLIDSSDISKEIYLKIGPLIGVQSQKSLVRYIPKRLSQDFAKNFVYNFYKFSENVYSIDDNFIEKSYIQSQDNLYDFLKAEFHKKIILGNYLGDMRLDRDLLDKILSNVRIKLYNTKYHTSFKSISRIIEASLYYDKNIPLNVRANTIDLEIDQVIDPKTNRPFKLTIQKEELLQVDFKLWGRGDILSSISKETTKSALTSTVSNLMDHLKELIMDETVGNKKVRIFPLVRIVSGGKDYGYQYLVPDRKADGSIKAKALKYLTYLPKSKPYFDIDLSNPGSKQFKQSLYQLEHIIFSLLPDMQGDLAFIVKEQDATYNDGKMLFGFNREGYFDKDELFSDGSGGNDLRSANNYINYPMIIQTALYKFKQADWDKFIGTNFPLRGDAIGSFFTDYMIYLKTSQDERAIYLRESILTPYLYSLPSNLNKQRFITEDDFPFYILT